jgi:hypothetical protein
MKNIERQFRQTARHDGSRKPPGRSFGVLQATSWGAYSVFKGLVELFQGRSSEELKKEPDEKPRTHPVDKKEPPKNCRTQPADPRLRHRQTSQRENKITRNPEARFHVSDARCKAIDTQLKTLYGRPKALNAPPKASSAPPEVSVAQPGALFELLENLDEGPERVDAPPECVDAPTEPLDGPPEPVDARLKPLDAQKQPRSIPSYRNLTIPVAIYLIATLTSLALALWWTLAHSDISGGFTMGAYVWGVVIFPTGYWHWSRQSFNAQKETDIELQQTSRQD